MNKENQSTPKHMRAKEASKYLSIGLSTFWLYVKQGKVTPHKLSQRVTVFKTEDLDRFVGSYIEPNE